MSHKKQGPEMKELLEEQVEVLKSIQEDVDPTFQDDIASIIENYGPKTEEDDLDLPLSIDGHARDKVVFAIGYIRGVAEERNCTVRELFDQEDISP